jgi:hypothetical protein
LVEAHDIRVVQASDPRADLGFRYGRDLVHHQAAGRAQSVARVGLDREPEQGRIRCVGGEGADGDGISRVEAVVLNDHDGSGLAGIVLAARDGANLAAFHGSRIRRISFIAPVRYRVDERLIAARVGARRDGQRLAMGLRAKGARTHVRHPNLDGAQA